MVECMDSLGTANEFSALDTNNADLRNEPGERDMDAIVLVTHNKLYSYVRMPFVYKTSPAPFKRMMGIILAPVKS